MQANEMLDYFRQQQEPTLNLLRALVERESPSGDGARLDTLAQFVAAELREIADEIELMPYPGKGTNLLARIRGTHAQGEKQLLVVWNG